MNNPIPPCFESREQYDGWMEAARWVRPHPSLGFCEDCTKSYCEKMAKEGRCLYPLSKFDEHGQCIKRVARPRSRQDVPKMPDTKKAILRLLRRTPSTYLRAADIAVDLGISTNAASISANRLVDAGLVVRQERMTKIAMSNGITQMRSVVEYKIATGDDDA